MCGGECTWLVEQKPIACMLGAIGNLRLKELQSRSVMLFACFKERVSKMKATDVRPSLKASVLSHSVSSASGLGPQYFSHRRINAFALW